jgi:hypothetical protein
MDRDETKNEPVAPEQAEAAERLPYTRPTIHSSDAFETFSLTSCGLVPGGCVDGTNP